MQVWPYHIASWPDLDISNNCMIALRKVVYITNDILYLTRVYAANTHALSQHSFLIYLLLMIIVLLPQVLCVMY